ncbi:hypothetical protein B566_EDAN015378 [Ephemera danica]|nr:hypothetical protein B566_EDAN015378 [Ephemera danica]
MGNSMSPSGTSDNSDMDFPNPQCLASNYFTDESSEEEFDWNPCCPERDRLSLVKIIDDMVTYMRGIFVTKEIQDVMKTVMSVHYNVGEVEEEDNKFHVCFAPRRELSANTNFVEFLEKLQLSPGHFFLHLGSGTGYLSTLAGLLIGASGINHGVEVNPEMLAYAEERQNAFRDHCVDLQKFEYCEPMFILGDCLKMEGDIRLYDRIFCSGMLPQGYENLLKLYLKEGGILIFPKTNRVLVNVKRVGKEQFDTQENNTSRPMDFYQFVSTSTDVPTVLPDELIPTLQQLSRGAIRQHIRSVQQSPIRKRDHNDSSSEPPRKRLYLSDDQNSPETPAPNPEMEDPSAMNHEAVQNSPARENSNNQVIFYVNPQDDGDLSDSDSSVVSTVPYEDSTSDDFPSPAHIQPRRIRTLSYDSADSEGERDWRRRQSQRRREDDVLSSDPDLDEIFAPDSDADYCSDCDLELEKSVPQKVKPYNPNAIYPPSALNTKINTLPLPKHLKWYLKYKHCLVFPLQPTVAQ